MKILVIPSGEVGPKESLTDTATLFRLEVGLKVWRSGDYDLVLLCGGICQRGQWTPDAQLMRRWLLQQPGAPRHDQILCEEHSLDTFENAKLGLDVIRSNFPYSEILKIGVVTHYLHGFRFLYSLNHGFGYKGETYVHQANNRLLPHELITEILLVELHLLDPKGQSFLPRLNRRRRALAARPIYRLDLAPLE